jgi:6-phosphogluconate dehydrogenase (decarboxylating)
MGANMVRRLIKSGHQCVLYDRAPQAVSTAKKAILSGMPCVVADLF